MNKSELEHWYSDSVPCRSSCPADTDIPGYLEAIYHGDYQSAYNINFNNNFFPEVLGRVCSRPCEKACRHGVNDNGDSVSICFQKELLVNTQIINLSLKINLKQQVKIYSL